jgi:hypothetical protein
MSEEFSPDNFHTNLLILQKTLLQIQKDFEFAGIPLSFENTEALTFQKITEKIQPLLAELMTKNYQGFMNLLYRIDLNESRIKKETAAQPEKKFEEIIAALVIKRELQKVVIKEYYKNNQDEI